MGIEEAQAVSSEYSVDSTEAEYPVSGIRYPVRNDAYLLPDTEYRVPDTADGLPAVGPGQVAVLSGDPGLGMTRLGLVLLSEHARIGPVAYLDVRGWLSPLAAWEVGIEPDRLVIARCNEAIHWGRAAATLLDGASAVLAEVPSRARDAAIRKLAALARSRGTPLLLRPLGRGAPAGVAHLTLQAHDASWGGIDEGHGRIERRTLRVTASGKAMRGMARTIEMEDDGSNTLRVVSGVAAAKTGGAAG